MQINWKARLKNKAFIVSMVTALVALVYQILGLFGIVPGISEAAIIKAIMLLVNMLACLGILVDPTTEGVSDSNRAMTYGTEFDERNIDESDGAADEREEAQLDE